MLGSGNQRIEPLVLSDHNTVVAAYEPSRKRSSDYQSESQLEAQLIQTLQDQGYEYLTIRNERDLIDNLRTQLEKLNNIAFSDSEWDNFFATTIAAANEGVLEKTLKIQQDHIQSLTRDDGSTKNIRLIDKRNITNNRLQVINQYTTPTENQGAGRRGRRSHRYDVTILVNGLPLVHIELKRRGVSIREAFNQIERYDRESFLTGSGLFRYIQLFVISNGTHTKYYSNTTRDNHVKTATNPTLRGASQENKTSHSFEFTSWWADKRNRPIQDLEDFSRTFLAQRTLLAIITRYCVLTSTEPPMLLVMRPYQIVATEEILLRINTSLNHKLYGSTRSGGYVWHTTGSGKTLTSFKTAQLATRIEGIGKVLFVVDRKDLDYQTIKEYDRFEKGAANSNASTAVLKRQLEDPNARIIVTTIQKLATFIKANKGHTIYSEPTVIIFDECHRSQFGSMHRDITRAFKKYFLFGFTGTPIFNFKEDAAPDTYTTEDMFGEKLHTYSIVDAIADGNVLPFHIDYLNLSPVNTAEEQSSKELERLYLAPGRIEAVTQYILEHFDQKTQRNQHYKLGDKRVSGFNALFATASITAACLYYQEFQKQQAHLPQDQRLKVGLIFSQSPENGAHEFFDTDELGPEVEQSVDRRQTFENAVDEHNDAFGTSFTATPDGFDNYYKDLSSRIKSRQVDLVIVVNMFLTGFDATTLNTLFVDKNLKLHGLIQAYSRTNRILNSVKAFGNIVSFRDLEEATIEALTIFGNKDAKNIAILRPFAEYLAEYKEKIQQLIEQFPVAERIVGEARQSAFAKLFGEILRLENTLRNYDEFNEADYLSARDKQDYTSTYLEIHDRFTNRDSDPDQVDSDDAVDIYAGVEFEIELLQQVEVNVDYILSLVAQRSTTHTEQETDQLRNKLIRTLNSTPSLKNRRDLFLKFFDDNPDIKDFDDASDRWTAFIRQQQSSEIDWKIQKLGLDKETTKRYMQNWLRNGRMDMSGGTLAEIVGPAPRFVRTAGRNLIEKKHNAEAALSAHFERFNNIGTSIRESLQG